MSFARLERGQPDGLKRAGLVLQPKSRSRTWPDCSPAGVWARFSCIIGNTVRQALVYVESIEKEAPNPCKTGPEIAVDRWPTWSGDWWQWDVLPATVPMTSSQTSIQWDAADQFQARRITFSQELHAGRIPSGRLIPGGLPVSGRLPGGRMVIR